MEEPSRWHSFSVKLAKQYGVPAAIIIRHFAFWIEKNKAHGKYFHDGRTWSYCTIKGLAEIFDYWTIRQIRVILDKLLREGVILKANYNSKKYDRTLWYAFVDENRFVKIDKSNSQNGQKDLPDRANGVDRNDRPIPITNTNTHTDRNTNTIIERKPSEVLALDVEIVEKRNFWLDQLSKIFHINKREARTFGAITEHIVTQCQCGHLKPSIFTDAVEWARQARASEAANKKGLLCRKLIKETGYKSPQKLLPTI